jgi:hypothetical protein
VDRASQGSCYRCLAGTYKGAENTLDCAPCPTGTYQSIVGSSYCETCSPGTYQPAVSSIACRVCSAPAVPAGSYLVPCAATTDTSFTACTFFDCPRGTYIPGTIEVGALCPSGNNQTSRPACPKCAAGTYRNDLTTYTCADCAAGKYQTGVGMDGCLDCPAQKPVDAFYTTTGLTALDSPMLCPFQCNAGFGQSYTGGVYACTACEKGMHPVDGQCTPCTDKPSINAYYVEKGCDWDCNEGYRKSGANCIICQTGFFSSLLRTLSDQTENTCHPCAVCPSTQFVSASCTVLHDTVCSPITPACNAGYYRYQEAATAHDLVCRPCKTSCAPDYYLFGDCSGGDKTDVTLCKPCLLPADCQNGLYLPSRCTGLTQVKNKCSTCSEPQCSRYQFRTQCSGSADSTCVGYTNTCPAGQYLAGYSLTQDGTCTPCTDCASLGLTTRTACRANCVSSQCNLPADAVCSGVSCTPSTPCANTPTRQLFCDLATRTCNVCPEGYASDGWNCLECNRTQTCDVNGQPQCKGEVVPGFAPGCYKGFAFRSGTACPVVAPGFAVVTRGTYL